MLTQKRFNHVVREDGWLGSRIKEAELRAVRDLVPSGIEVLDYGCGTGLVALDLARRGCAVTAYDPMPELVVRARTGAYQANLQIEFVNAEAELRHRKWPFITCLGLLDYYPYPVPLLTKLRNHLNPEGGIVMTCLNALSPLTWSGLLGSHVAAHTARSLRWAVVRAGLRVWNIDFAFPRVEFLGHTLVVILTTGLSRV